MFERKYHAVRFVAEMNGRSLSRRMCLTFSGNSEKDGERGREKIV